jgi:flagellum-specific peptidoglycan hydrolase FlgJ
MNSAKSNLNKFSVFALIISIVAVGCESTPEMNDNFGSTESNNDSSSSNATNSQSSSSNATNSQSSSSNANKPISRKRYPSLPPTPMVGITVSFVSASGLKVNAINPEAIADWFNKPWSETSLNPFIEPMEKEIDTIDPTAKNMGELKLSPVTVATLKLFQIMTPSDISGFDKTDLKKQTKFINDQCRNEIAAAMMKINWSLLRAQISNPVHANVLTINGKIFGWLDDVSDKVWRRFLVQAPGADSDPRTIVTLSVDLPSSINGLPSVRWFKDIQLERGVETRLNEGINISAAPVPSIGFNPKNPLSPAAVYAGDKVSLTVEGGGPDTIWFELGFGTELNSSNYETSPADSIPSTGLPAWFEFRKAASSVASPRNNLLNKAKTYPIIIGKGATLNWIPQFETPAARIGVLVRDASGFWGFAQRNIAVADLRPGIWLMPQLPLNKASSNMTLNAERGFPMSPANIYITYAVLSNLTYVVQEGVPASFDMYADEYQDSSLPPTGATIDFGDGTKPVQIAGADVSKAQINHVFTKPGTFRITTRINDIMGFERSHGTNILVSAKPIEPESVSTPKPAPNTEPALTPEPAPTPEVIVRLIATRAESSMDLFRRAAQKFANQLVSQTKRVTMQKKVGLAHIHDLKDQTLIDVMDSSIVENLLSNNIDVYEREPLYQHAIAARGFIDSSTIVVPDQGGTIPDIIMTSVADGDASNPELTMKLLEKMGTTLPPDVDVVIEYKLKRAEVTVIDKGDLRVRTANLFAFVRVHDRKTMRILSDYPVEVSISDSIVKTESSSSGATWDSLPEGFMIRNRSNDQAIEKIDIKVVPNVPATETIRTNVKVQGIDMLPSTAPKIETPAPPVREKTWLDKITGG